MSFIFLLAKSNVSELKYHNKPIYEVESLAKHLGSTPSNLRKLAENSHKYYWPKTKPKKNGGIRTFYSIKEPLKPILKKIRERILVKVTFPPYLHGSIKGRSPKTNAQIHVGAKCLIEMDIADFFPSIKKDQVFRIFRYFFNFSIEVSDLLADLTTHQGKVPQGSPVSSDLANLVLCWDGKESLLVENLTKKGLRVSRFMDDIAISSAQTLTDCEKTEIIKMVSSFISSKGFKVSHKKTSVSGPRKTKCVTGLRIGKDRNNVTNEYVDSVYRQIKQLENDEDLSDKRIASLRGKINYIRQYNPKQAIRLEHILFSLMLPTS